MFPYWDAWNINHVTKHGVSQDEAEYVVNHARPPYPSPLGEGKLAVWGATESGRQLQVIYIYRPVSAIDLMNVPPHRRLELHGTDEVLYIIHARELNRREKRRLRRRQ